jgi:hypothetical protein
MIDMILHVWMHGRRSLFGLLEIGKVVLVKMDVLIPESMLWICNLFFMVSLRLCVYTASDFKSKSIYLILVFEYVP